ncbi:MAG: hypothetical protein RSD99_09610, partial [Janthinobacterium sp.]
SGSMRPLASICMENVDAASLFSHGLSGIARRGSCCVVLEDVVTGAATCAGCAIPVLARALATARNKHCFTVIFLDTGVNL